MNRTSFALPLSALLLLAAAPSQDAVDTAAAMRSHGVVTSDGLVRGVGPDYSARFDARGVEFTPALGAAAERPFPVRFTMESVRRGANEVFVRTVDVAPAVTGDQVRYVHRGDLVEVYDVRADGIEQSFVFATRPAGTGDLVVRGAITTELPLAQASDDGVRFEREGLGGVSFGAVTGVDANGATARGSIRVSSDGSHVEWVLPATFVDGAAYPLVLDPLIGSAFAIGDVANGTDVKPRVAFDAGSARYCSVWMVDTGGNTGEVRAQFMSTTGSLIGSSLVVATAARTASLVAVANVHDTGRFLVCWAEATLLTSNTQWRLMIRSIQASTGAMSTPVHFATYLVANTVPNAFLAFDVGGDSRNGLFGTAQNALVVWREVLATGSSELYSGFAHVPSSGDPALVGTGNLLATGDIVEVDVTSHGGSLGQWAMAWTTRSQPSGPPDELRTRVFNSSGPCSVATLFQFAPVIAHPTCATGAVGNFAIAWSDGFDVNVKPFTFTGSCPGTLVQGTAVDPLSIAGLADQPVLDFAGNKYVLAYRHRTTSGATARVMVKGLDPATCGACGTEWFADVVGATQSTPAVIAQRSGASTTNDEALLVWSNNTIRGRRFETRSNDVVTSMGGACSITGFDDLATYNGDAVLGATDFELVLFNPVSLPLVMILGFSAIAAPCGSCTIMPSLDVLLPAANPLPLAIPCDPLLVGVDLYTQWLLLKPSDCPILPDFAFSNSLRFTIGE